jgi:hypothetical protein
MQPAPVAVAAAAPAPAPAPVAASEPASVTQPLAALSLLETPVEQPLQLGLLGEEPPAQQASPQLELLGDDRKLMSG